MADSTWKLKGLALLLGVALMGVGCSSDDDDDDDKDDTKVTVTQKQAVLESYAEMAYAGYSKALTDAQALQTAIGAFEDNATASTLEAAKEAWLTARESYGPTEVFRLSEGPIDAEGNWVEELYGALEGQINAWPLDENMIDYTIDEDGNLTNGNIIDSTGMFTPSGDDAEAVDITTLDADTLTALNENGGEANVATGYHAIEFLLWGQDQDYENGFVADEVTNGAQVAGQRPLEDFTSDTHASRRLAYLKAAADKLVADLTIVKAAWNPDTANCTTGVGCYRAAFLGELSGDDAEKNIATDTALKQVMIGMGVFIKSEVANERVAVAVLTPSEEDEHSCFSDNTHRDIDLNYKGFKWVLKGEYDGETYGEESLYSLSGSKAKSSIDTLVTSIESAVSDVNTLATQSTGGCHFDYQIKPAANAPACSKTDEITAMKNDMRDLGDLMVPVASAFGISLTEEDVTDPEETIVEE